MYQVQRSIALMHSSIKLSERNGHLMSKKTKTIIKRISIIGIIAGLCLSLSACNENGKDYDEIQRIQKNVAAQESGHMIISSRIAPVADENNAVSGKADNVTNEFTFKLNASGAVEYCQTQMDSSNKMIFCEISDGEKSEQWLLGKGWSSIDTTTYSKENPHQYIGIIINDIDKGAIGSIDKEIDGDNTVYRITMDVKKLNENHYKDANAELISHDISFTENKDGQLLRYTDDAVIAEGDTKLKNEYSLDIQMNEHNMIGEIKKPELRANAAVSGDITAKSEQLTEPDEGK